MSSESFWAFFKKAGLPPAAAAYFRDLGQRIIEAGLDPAPLAREISKITKMPVEETVKVSNYQTDQLVVSAGWSEGAKGLKKE